MYSNIMCSCVFIKCVYSCNNNNNNKMEINYVFVFQLFIYNLAYVTLLFTYPFVDDVPFNLVANKNECLHRIISAFSAKL